MLFLLLGCATTCPDHFVEGTDGLCYSAPSEEEATPTTPEQAEALVLEVLGDGLPDPGSIVDRLRAWAELGDSDCPGGDDEFFYTEGCTTSEGTYFFGKMRMQPQALAHDFDLGAGADVFRAVIAVAMETADGRTMGMGGHTSMASLDGEAWGFVGADFEENPAVYPWMAKGSGAALYMLWTDDTLQLDGGIDHPLGALYFQDVEAGGGCVGGTLQAQPEGQHDWTEVALDGCGCADFESSGPPVCEAVAGAFEDLSTRLTQWTP